MKCYEPFKTIRIGKLKIHYLERTREHQKFVNENYKHQRHKFRVFKDHNSIGYYSSFFRYQFALEWS